jgi:hypothetical protein
MCDRKSREPGIAPGLPAKPENWAIKLVSGIASLHHSKVNRHIIRWDCSAIIQK